MRRTIMRYLAVTMLAMVPVAALAQPGADQTPDARLLARADSITVGDYCRVAQSVLASAGVNQILGADSADARVSAGSICDPLLSRFSLSAAILGRGRAPFVAVARLRTEGAPSARRTIFDAMSEFRATVRGEGVREAIRDTIPDSLATSLARITETANGLLLVQARDRALMRLAKYERKLGPTSAKLNLPEVVLNYGAQRWIPGFRPTPLGGPSPLEVVASYTPAYIPFEGGRVQPVSASEFGVRYYLFGEAFGGSGWRGVLLPSYWSVGVLTVSDREGALVSPWEGRDHSGPYLSWGSLKLAFVPGRSGGAWLASKQFQMVPLAF